MKIKLTQTEKTNNRNKEVSILANKQPIAKIVYSGDEYRVKWYIEPLCDLFDCNAKSLMNFDGFIDGVGETKKLNLTSVKNILQKFYEKEIKK